MEQPTSPAKDNHNFEVYQGSPIVGSPGRVPTDTAPTSCVETQDKPLTFVKFTDINLSTHKKVGGRIAIKGQVEKTSSIALISGGPGRNVSFFATNLCDDVSISED